MNTLSSIETERLKEVGSYLREKRLEKSLSIEEVSSITHIRGKLVEALENGQSEELPEIIYVRGFIRRYSELLQVDPEVLLKRVSQIPKSSPASAPSSPPPTPVKAVVPPLTNAAPKTKPASPTSKPTPSSGFKLSWLLYLLVLAGAVYGLFYVLSQPAPSPSLDPVATSPQPPANPSPPSANTSSAPAASPPKPASSPVVKQEATTSPQPKPSPTPAAQQPVPLGVTVKLEGSSWLEVRADGKKLYEGILGKGEQKTWTAKQQITLRSGNAGAVSWSKDGKSFQPLGSPGQVKEVTVKAQ